MSDPMPGPDNTVKQPATTLADRPATPSPPTGIWNTRVRFGSLEISFPQALLAAGIAFYAFAMPGDAKFKLDAMGFGVCHQIHAHSFTIGGHQLPLCARCTGIYLGAVAALFLLLTLRRRAVRLPAGGMLGVLGLFFVAMVADGLNSTAQSFDSGVWDSTNTVRLITGTLSGLSVAFMLYPVFNLSLWHRERRVRENVLEHGYELLACVVLAAILVAFVLDGGDLLLYPLSFLSIGGMLALLTMSNAMLIMLITRKEGQARTPHDVLTFVLWGLVLSLVMLTLLSWGRASLAPMMEGNALGVPALPGLP